MELAPSSLPFPLTARAILAHGCQLQEDLAVMLARLRPDEFRHLRPRSLDHALEL